MPSQIPSPSNEWKSWADFIVHAPPNSAYSGTDAVEMGDQGAYLSQPELKHYCDVCDGERWFVDYDGQRLGVGTKAWIYFTYACRDCTEFERDVAILCFRDKDAVWEKGVFLKLGEWPSFG